MNNHDITDEDVMNKLMECDDDIVAHLTRHNLNLFRCYFYESGILSVDFLFSSDIDKMVEENNLTILLPFTLHGKRFYPK